MCAQHHEFRAGGGRHLAQLVDRRPATDNNLCVGADAVGQELDVGVRIQLPLLGIHLPAERMTQVGRGLGLGHGVEECELRIREALHDPPQGLHGGVGEIDRHEDVIEHSGAGVPLRGDLGQGCARESAYLQGSYLPDPVCAPAGCASAGAASRLSTASHGGMRRSAAMIAAIDSWRSPSLS